MKSHKSQFGVATMLLLVLALAACSKSDECGSAKDVSDRTAKFASDVQAASLKNKLSMDQLKQITIRMTTASDHYVASKNAAQYCADIDSIRKDSGL